MTIRPTLSASSSPKNSEAEAVGEAAPSVVDGEASPAARSVRAADIRTSLRPTVATVDRGALQRNAARLKAWVGPGVDLFGVIKADAYGHGAVAVAETLGPLCRMLAVSLVEEGLELREAGHRGPILVLGGYYNGAHSEIFEADLVPVVYDLGNLEQFARAPLRRRPSAMAHLRPFDIHLKIDTGMSRLGIAADDMPAALAQIENSPQLRLAGLCTHLSSADSDDPSATHGQLKTFATAVAVAKAQGHSPQFVHAANSAAAVRFAQTRFSAVRPGIALFGGASAPSVLLPEVEPVLSLHSRIMALRTVEVGTTVSYGGRWRASRRTVVATLPVGYADGYPRHVNEAWVLIRGQKVPLLGVVCMDMFMVDVTDVPGAAVGDTATLLGQDSGVAITLDELARWAGTINYEILCGLSKRVPRVYRDAESAQP